MPEKNNIHMHPLMNHCSLNIYGLHSSKNNTEARISAVKGTDDPSVTDKELVNLPSDSV
jgi:hypothetical protein